ncbi:hypothetical protein C8035_v005485 [Colletotrichum spinosum]|uniref:Uncharacterized protein n=1 Tax=Colletotrichum spinosum TaxID=1347390 RepID=A0A4R8PVN7_9PEZI|nr:hypothetical protein C8035_v005485 [Colletotrichum spinosum]
MAAFIPLPGYRTSDGYHEVEAPREGPAASPPSLDDPKISAPRDLDSDPPTLETRRTLGQLERHGILGVLMSTVVALSIAGSNSLGL